MTSIIKIYLSVPEKKIVFYMKKFLAGTIFITKLLYN